MKTYAIILAGGIGERLGSKTPKCFIKVKDKEIYKYCLETFVSVKKIKKIVLVVPKTYLKKINIQDKRLIVVAGGNDRNKSFEAGMKSILDITKPMDKVLIHDAARPNVQKQDILNLIKSNQDYGTLAYVGKKNGVDFHIGKWNIQTPQFTRIWLYNSIKSKNLKGKDLISYFGLIPEEENYIVSSNKNNNFKITFKKDLELFKNQNN